MIESYHNRIILILASLLLLIGLYSAIFDSDDSGPDQIGRERKRVVSRASGPNKEGVRPKSTPSTKAAIQDAVVQHEARLTPDLGPSLKRGKARAEFQLWDGKNQVLSTDSRLSARLFRQVGQLWVELPESWQLGDIGSTLMVAGRSGVGLEPGHYELEIDAFPYGTKIKSFTLTGQETLRGTIDFEIWRKIITFKFVDQFGQPLSRLGFRPYVSSSSRPLAPSRRPLGPPSRQDVERRHASPLDHRRRNKRIKGPRGSAFLLDQGQWHMPVYVGARNDINLDFDVANYGLKPFHLQSDFKGSEQIQTTFAVTMTEDFRGLLGSKSAANPDDFGNASEITTPTLIRTPRRQGPSRPSFLDLDFVQLTPTLASYTLAVQVRWNLNNKIRGRRMKVSTRAEIGTSMRGFADALPPIVAKCDTVGIQLQGADNLSGMGFSFDFPIGRSNMDDLNRGRLTVGLPDHGVVMRIVNHLGEPQAWSRAAILTLQDSRQGGRPSQKKMADCDGFLFFPHLKLTPSEDYVLYLWGDSPQANQPLRRLLFQAQRGVTDLGAIKVPSTK